MRILVSILFCLIAFVGFAQVFQINNAPYKFRGLIGDTVLVIPSAIDTPYMANPKWGQPITGALHLRKADSTLWAKINQSWVKLGGQSLLDSLSFLPVIDSTGQDNFRVLFANNKKILSSPQLVYDSVKNILKINSTISTAGYGLAVGDNTILQGLLRLMSVPSAGDDTTNYKPLVFSTSGNRLVSRLDYWPGGSGGSGSVEYVVSGMAIRVDSAGRVYTINWDSAHSTALSRQRADNTYGRLNNVNHWLTRNRFTSLILNKDSIPISTTDAWILSLDTIGGSNRVQRRSATSFLPGGTSLNVQYRDTATGLFAGDADFNFEPTLNRLLIGYPVGSASGRTNGVAASGGFRTGNLELASNSITNATANSFTILGGGGQMAAVSAGSNRVLNLGAQNESSADGRGVLVINGSTSSTIDPSVIMEIRSTIKGFLPPVQTAVQRLAISSPATGLLVYDTDSGRVMQRTASAWKGYAFTNETGGGSSSGWGLTGNAGTVAGTNFLGTTDNIDLVLKRNSVTAARFESSNVFVGAAAGDLQSGAVRSSFFGPSAGYSTTNTTNSAFINYNAGNGSIGITSSNFIGDNSGLGIASASNLNLIGSNVGTSFTSNTIGNNNTIIGTNISLPNATANAINIGGVIFGTGAYSTTSGNPSIVPATDARVGIGIVTPATSSILDLTSTDKGLLIPRMTSSDRTSISSPATGLEVFDTDSLDFFFYDGSAWVSVSNRSWANNTLSGADVAMTLANTWYTGATLTLGVGTWAINGNIAVKGTGTAPIYEMRIHDGTNTIISAPPSTTASSGSRQSTASMMTIYVITSGTKTITLQASSSITGGSIAYQTPTQTQAACTQLNVVKLRR